MLVKGDHIQIQGGNGRIGFRLGQTTRAEFRQNFGEIDRTYRRPTQVLGVELAELLVLQQREISRGIGDDVRVIPAPSLAAVRRLLPPRDRETWERTVRRCSVQS